MNKVLTTMTLALSALLLSATAHADTRIMEVWLCTLNEGHTIEEAKTTNSDWVRYVNESVTGGDIQSYVTTPVVGTLGQFMFVDSFPSMAAWAATKEALREEEGLAVDAAIAEVTTCESNSLYLREES